ncbi:hypothetical protein U9M48_029279 [Paspalum notatum var. saurae]|uniref:SKI-interacting protein SKIP SNW domain-containing protein n=1 Tax=Paspalum notatum var. saurae TaxID=547442 RepID=A0AAQ3X258_PASNO
MASPPSSSSMPEKPLPPYGTRGGLVPRRPEDFGGCGAFPEVHVAQYPLSMGIREAAAGSSVLAVTVDARGQVAFDAVVRQGQNAAKIVYSSHADLVPKIGAPGRDADDEDDEEEATTARTRAALQAIIDARLSVVQPPASARRDPAFVKYRPARQSAAFNSGAEERVVRVEHAQEDPVLPPKHRRRRVPRPAGSPPVTVTHSPSRPVSRKDMEDWRIPPSVSDWKNPKGYSIPLDKRAAAAADGRRMEDVQVSDGFAGLSEALYVAERKAREAIEARDKVRMELRMREQEQREQQLREIANKARAERASDAAPAPPPPVYAAEQRWEERAQRDTVRQERRRQREWERRREASSGKKSRVTRDRDRDVGERIALGMASTGGAGAGEVTYDERLFNQDTGMDSGFAADDQYNVYSGRLFGVQPALSTTALFRPNKHGDSDIYGCADEQIEKMTKTDMFKPHKGFSGALDRADGKRERPCELDGPVESGEAEDPFVELDRYMSKVNEGKKQ